MTDEVQVVGGQEFVARGRVEAEKAELLREIRGELSSAGRLEAENKSVLPITPTHVPLLARQSHSEIFVLLALVLVITFFLVAYLLFLSFSFGVFFA